MHKLFFTVAAALILGGCSTAAKHDNFDAITAQVANGVSKPAVAPASDDAVANALVPPVSTLTEQLPKARQALEERFNVAFNDVPVQQFFNSIAAGTRYNILIHPDVTGTITANLKDVTLFEALDAVRELYGYDYKVEGTRIYIRPLTMQTRMFHVNYLVGSRRGSSNLRVTSTSVSDSGTNNQNNLNNQNGQGYPYQNQGGQGQNGQNNPQTPGNNIVQRDGANVNTTSDSDFWDELKSALTTIVGKEGGRSVVISPQSGVLVIRAMPDELRSVDMYLKATQLSVDRQVILEAKILEVELNDSYQSGVNWASFASFNSKHDNRMSTGMIGPGTALSPLPLGGGQPPVMADGNGFSASSGFSLANAATAGASLFGLAFQTSNFSALISFLESQGTVHVLSSPRVAAVNNQKAVLKIGTDEFFLTGVTTTTSTSTVGATTTPSVTLTPFFSGVVLDVTPQIDDHGNIILHVHPSVSQVTTVNKNFNLGTAGNFTLPLAASSTSEIDSMVRGQDGKVVVIGGLMRQASTNDSSGLPGVNSVPVLGALFGNKNQVNQKRELIVLIKPTIVEGSSAWNEDLLETTRRMKDLDPRSRERK
jgi:MSHA biogenesis protein MshL